MEDLLKHLIPCMMMVQTLQLPFCTGAHACTFPEDLRGTWITSWGSFLSTEMSWSDTTVTMHANKHSEYPYCCNVWCYDYYFIVSPQGTDFECHWTDETHYIIRSDRVDVCNGNSRYFFACWTFTKLSTNKYVYRAMTWGHWGFRRRHRMKSNSDPTFDSWTDICDDRTRYQGEYSLLLRKDTAVSERVQCPAPFLTSGTLVLETSFDSTPSPNYHFDGCTTTGVIRLPHFYYSQHFDGCGHVYTDNYGVLMSPNFPSLYPNISCEYLIIAPPDHYVKVYFLRIDVHGRCGTNPFVLYNGRTTDDDVIRSFCGYYPTPSFYSSTSENLLLVLSPYGDDCYCGDSGFYLTYTFELNATRTQDSPTGVTDPDSLSTAADLYCLYSEGFSSNNDTTAFYVTLWEPNTGFFCSVVEDGDNNVSFTIMPGDCLHSGYQTSTNLHFHYGGEAPHYSIYQTAACDPGSDDILALALGVTFGVLVVIVVVAILIYKFVYSKKKTKLEKNAVFPDMSPDTMSRPDIKSMIYEIPRTDSGLGSQISISEMNHNSYESAPQKSAPHSHKVNLNKKSI